MSAAYVLTRLVSGLVVMMPFPVLYFFSDCLYLIIYYLTGYRKKVVRENLLHAFPEKSKKECIRIEKDFYHHLCDLLFEVLKIPGLSTAELKKRVHFTNPEIFAF